jgi:trehalose-6-phosphate synthase
MGPGERHARMRILRQQVRDHDLSWWLSEVLETAGELRSRRGEPHVRAE